MPATDPEKLYAARNRCPNGYMTCAPSRCDLCEVKKCPFPLTRRFAPKKFRGIYSQFNDNEKE